VVLWFLITWQLAWWLWTATVGRLGQRWVRWARLRLRRGLVVNPLIRCIAPARHALTACVFVPVFVTMVLTHKCKWGDGRDPLSAVHLQFQTERIPTRDRLMLDAWFVPEDGATRTLLVLHGAGANKGNFVWYLGPLAHHGYNLLMIDFRAHGNSDGHVTSWGVRERVDVLAAVDWLKRHHPNEARKVVGLGSSQGALALTLAGAEDQRIDAFILDSPFISARTLAYEYTHRLPGVGRLLADYVLCLMSAWSAVDLFGPGSTLDVSTLGHRPVMLIHGNQDDLVSVDHAREIFSAAQGPRELWSGAGRHSNIITTDPDRYASRVFGFLAKSLGAAD
jgi:pimeloyl-ACP methyl ester carboxylesterase